MEFENDPSNNPDDDSVLLNIISSILITFIAVAPIFTMIKVIFIDHYMNK